MIYFRNVSLSFLDRQLFDQLNWTIHPKSRVGLVGDNGTGKTTLFRIILDQIHPDSGLVDIPDLRQKKIGYLPQDMVELDSIGMMEFLRRKSGIATLEENIRALELQIADTKPNTQDYSELTRRYSDLSAEFTARDGYAFEARAKQILKGFGFREADFDKSCESFSGGWKMRILLTAILLDEPDIMLLDEPTNHLDTESMEWLESYLRDYHGTIIVISHDHFFLDRIATQIAELAGGHINIYKGNYTYYLAEKKRRQEALAKEMELQKAQIKKIEEFVERFRYKASKAAQVQSRIKMLEKYRQIQTDGPSRAVAMRFPEGKKSVKEVVKAADLGHSYGDVKVFSGLNFSIFRGEKVALVGVNGSGKSTLSRLLGLSEAPCQGTVTHGDHVSMAFFSQESAQNLGYENTIWQEVLAVPSRANDQERRNLLGAFLFSGDDILKQVGVLSGGEKSRLALLKIMLLDTNFLILDEPTNHLDIRTKDVFQNALLNYSGTVAIVSHDRYFLDHLVNRVFELSDGRMTDYRGNYSYFIEKRAQMAADAVVHNVTDVRATPQKLSLKEQKRIEAQERNKRSKVIAALKKEMAALEEKIAGLEARKSANEEALCNPQSIKDPAIIRDLHIDLKTVEKELEEAYLVWMELGSRLEKQI
ncbi:MAG TPA: ATP-binding cassette domain-containing protein [Smithellaceae bacterium]|nr:ATP-binding cassette domain-containing protein [Smithellaceae bacterium]HQF83654.1 ATP-binding cassette domain-containing protein [Smithellaceae bacterium]HQG79797.1 ATP-binding cassette domain-containing protein [Smithellaceae bacterium]